MVIFPAEIRQENDWSARFTHGLERRLVVSPLLFLCHLFRDQPCLAFRTVAVDVVVHLRMVLAGPVSMFETFHVIQFLLRCVVPVPLGFSDQFVIAIQDENIGSFSFDVNGTIFPNYPGILRFFYLSMNEMSNLDRIGC